MRKLILLFLSALLLISFLSVTGCQKSAPTTPAVNAPAAPATNAPAAPAANAPAATNAPSK